MNLYSFHGPGKNGVDASPTRTVGVPTPSAKKLSPRRLMDERDLSSSHSRSSSPPLPQTQISWTPVVAATVWQRMLKIVGDINNIRPPAMHHEAMLCLQRTWKQLIEVGSVQ